MQECKTQDGVKIYIESSIKVNGPSQKNGLCFGVTYVYWSIDKINWVKSNQRSKLQCQTWVESKTMQELINEPC